MTRDMQHLSMKMPLNVAMWWRSKLGLKVAQHQWLSSLFCCRSRLYLPWRYFKSHPRFSILLFLPVTLFISFIFLWISFLFFLDCQFELSGADGIIRSSQVEQEEKTKPGQAVDCIWTIKATPKAKVLFIICWLTQRRP